MLRSIALIAALLLCGPAAAQTNPGTSPLSIPKGGTGGATAAAARSSLGVAIGSNVEAWDADLDCIAANATAGVLARTGAGTCAARTLTAPAAGFTISNPAGTAGNPTFALANDLAAVEALASTGFAVRIATDTWAQRTVAGTTNEVCVSNGDGVAGNPTLSICAGFLSTAHSWAGAQTFASPVATGTFDLQGAMTWSGDISPAQLTANTNDWAPSGFSTATTLRFSTDASRNITGLAGGADGRLVILHNIGAQNAVLINASALSTAANRFAIGGDITLAGDNSITLRYDATSARWRAIDTPGASGGGGGSVSSVTIAAGGIVSVSGTCTITTSGTCTVTTAPAAITNNIVSNVSMNNTSLWFDGPTIAQGSTGTWWVSGTVSATANSAATNIYCKLWDGTTVISSAAAYVASAGLTAGHPITLSGSIVSPAGNLKISCNAPNSTSAVLFANQSGGGKDSSISAFRIQ